MARKREFYDATKPERRDESWRRWKGGQKLADQLRVFYTSKSALDRIARNNSFSPGAAQPNGEFKPPFRMPSGARHQMDMKDMHYQRELSRRAAAHYAAQKASRATATPPPGQAAPKR